MRTMQQLQRDMDANRRDSSARMCEAAIAAGNAADAASFAMGAVRAARCLAMSEMAIAEIQTEPSLRSVEFTRCYADVPPLLADMLDELEVAA